MAKETSRQQNAISRRGQYSSSPFNLMRTFADEMDRMFGDFWGTGLMDRADLPALRGQGIWSPQMEVFDQKGQMVVRADLPGLKKDDVNVEIEDGALVISGERKQENEQNRGGHYQSERSYGSFYRMIPLPAEVNPDDIKASFDNGVLEVRVPVPEQKKQTRQIQISEPGRTQETEKKGASAK